MIERLETIQANKKQFANGSELFNACKTDSTLRHEIEVLAKYYLNRKVSGCQNCYMDAYVELINYNLEKAMSKDTCKFKLRAGALLHDVVNFDNDLLCSNANITNELALYHLKTNKNAKKYFQTLPEDVDDLIEAFKLLGEELELSDAEKEALAAAALEQEKAEKELVAEIVTMLKEGSTKTAIRKKYEKQNVGTKQITQRLMTDLLKLADSEVTPE